jgi:hypothetical protein
MRLHSRVYQWVTPKVADGAILTPVQPHASAEAAGTKAWLIAKWRATKPPFAKVSFGSISLKNSGTSLRF